MERMVTAQCGRPRRAALLILTCALFLIAPAVACARGVTSMDMVGGTRFERAQVVAALQVSHFDFGLVSGRVQVTILRGIPSSYAEPGRIVLDADLLDAGEFSWGVVQHEFGHQVDCLLLSNADRAALADQLGGSAWSGDETMVAHSSLTDERFASTLAWAY